MQTGAFKCRRYLEAKYIPYDDGYKTHLAYPVGITLIDLREKEDREGGKKKVTRVKKYT